MPTAVIANYTIVNDFEFIPVPEQPGLMSRMGSWMKSLFCTNVEERPMLPAELD